MMIVAWLILLLHIIFNRSKVDIKKKSKVDIDYYGDGQQPTGP